MIQKILMHKIGFLCLFTMNSLVHASLSPRIQELLFLDEKITLKGPNCVSSVFYSVKLTDDYIYSATSSLASVLASHYCKEIKAENRDRGDLVIVYGEIYRYDSYVPHAALLTGRNHAFSKMGFEAHNEGQQIKNLPLVYNPGSRIPKKCQSTLTHSKDSQDCQYEEASARYFRCQFSELRKQLQKHQTFKSILILRGDLMREYFHDQAKPRTKTLEHFSSQLSSIEHALLDEQKKHFPKLSIAGENHSGLEKFLAGFRIERYLFDDIKNLPKAFIELLIQAELVNSTRVQIQFLEK
jgi:hypothetical protein